MLKNKLTPHFIELTQDACLKAFWRKQALARFLRQHKIAESKLSTWGSDESKRDFLARLFDDLIRRKDNKGHTSILQMAYSLAEMQHFPDLEDWEDSSEKRQSANKAIARLKEKVDVHKEQISDKKFREERRQRVNKENEVLRTTKESLEKLDQRLKELVPEMGTQKAGYDFEKWFYDLAVFFEVQARKPYKDTNGRQIDGYLSVGDTDFLIETKFTQGLTGVTNIDSFMAKIHTKADNTMGILVSMPGFDQGAIKAASRDRTPMLLMDSSHVYLILCGQMTLPEVVQRIKRHAAQTGDSFLPVRKFSG